MCIFLYSFCFSINYKCNYGEFIALIGNTEELGNWDTSKALELQWTEVKFSYYNIFKFFEKIREITGENIVHLSKRTMLFFNTNT